MLLRFYVSNFMSFREEAEFNMFPGALKTHKDHIYPDKKLPLLKAAALYGANGSGKSNFIKAVHFLHDVVVEGELDKCKIKCQPFRLDKSASNLPSTFGMEFKIGKNYFEYIVSVKDNAITEEALYETNPAKETSEYIFERKSSLNKNAISVNPKWVTNEKEQIRFEIYGEELSPGESAIFKLKSRLESASQVVNWFEKHIWILYPQTKYFLTLRLCFDKDYKNFLNELLPKLDTGLKAIDVESIPFKSFFGEDDEPQQKDYESRLKKSKNAILFTKNGKEYVARKENQHHIVNKIKTFNAGEIDELVEFEPEEQSDGTRRILDLIPAIQKMTIDSSVFFIDEIDRSLHPSMTKSLLEYYMLHKTKGQLIFTTHESNLLDLEIFRQDEIWFSEKEKSGATRI